MAWALARHGRRDVVVFDPDAEPRGSTSRALGGFRTQHGSELNIQLALASRDFFVERADRVHFQSSGYLYLADTPEAVLELKRRAELQRFSGLPITHPDPLSLVPWLNTRGIGGANYCALDGVYIPLEILGCYREEARAGGAEFRLGLKPQQQDLEGAEVVVVASGICSREVGKSLGVELAVEAVERGAFITGPYDWLSDKVPMILEAGSGFHFRERDSRLWLMGPGDQRDWGRMRDWLAMRAPKAAVPEPETLITGFYEMTFDHHPLVGRTERPAVWASCGFSGHGVMHSPAIADSLASMLVGDTPSIDISALNPLRRESLIDATQL